MIHTIDLKFQNVPNAIAAFLVETSAGPVLIESGPHSTFKNLKAGIEQIGYRLSDIKHVFLSHIHFDHAGAAWAFAELGAKIYLHPFGAPHMADPSRLVESARRIYKDQMDILWGQLKPINHDSLINFQNGQSITIGDTEFISHHTPGHATHHIAWQVGKHLFAGDVAGVRINKGMVVPPCPPPDIHLEDWITSINLIRNLDIEHLYLTHFGKVEKIADHLDQLEFCLKTAIQEIIPQFQAYVANQLISYGIPEDGVKQYEAANPSWMSVAGLMRYWKKIKVV